MIPQPSDAPTLPPGVPNAPKRNRAPLFVALGAVLLVLLVTVAVLVLGGAGDSGGTITIAADQSGATDPAAPSGDSIKVIGDPLPAFEDTDADEAVGMTIPTITGPGVDGASVTIEPGKPTLVVVMAHWCPHCQAEIPRIVEWNDAGLIPRDLDVIGVSTAVDESKGNYPPASWLEREQWPFPVLEDDAQNTALTALGATGFPTFVAVGADGRVALRVSGETDEAGFKELVAAAINGAPDADTTTTTTASASSAACPAADGSSARQTEFDDSPPMCIDPAQTYSATFDTSMGSFKMALDAASAPQTVNNFVFLSRYHFYDGLTFHRVIADFVVQGGDLLGNGTGGPGYEFADELPTDPYEKYSVAMANSGPDTNGSQFFVISGEQGVGLSPDYSLFGKVVSGTEVIDAIQSVPTGDGDAPVTPVVINSVQIVEGS